MIWCAQVTLVSSAMDAARPGVTLTHTDKVNNTADLYLRGPGGAERAQWEGKPLADWVLLVRRATLGSCPLAAKRVVAYFGRGHLCPKQPFRGTKC